MDAWRPSPQDAALFEALWHAAETTGTGMLGGAAAVGFFSKSGLPKPVLKEVWNASNLRGDVALNKHETFVAFRLIQLAQQGHPVSRENLVASGGLLLPPPRFQGVEVNVPQAQPSAATAPAGSPSGAAGGWSITPAEASKYDAIFRSEDSDGDGKITGKQAVDLLGKSGLDKPVLKRIWALSDADKDGMLDRNEFHIAFHLALCASKRGMPVPEVLPRELAQLLSTAGGSAGAGLASVPSFSIPAATAAAVTAAGTGRSSFSAPVAAASASPNNNNYPARGGSMSLADALSSLDGMVEGTGASDAPPAHAPAPAPVPAPAPAPVAAPVVEDTFGLKATAAVPAPAMTMMMMPPTAPPAVPVAPIAPVFQQQQAQQPQPHFGGGYLAAQQHMQHMQQQQQPQFSAPAPVAPAPAPAPAPVASAGAGSGGMAMPSEVVAAAKDLGSALQSQLKRENVLLGERRGDVEAAHAEVKFLEQERAMVIRQVEAVRGQISEEDAEHQRLQERIKGLRQELHNARQQEAQAAGTLMASKGRNAEARGVAATLAAQLVSLTGTADRLSQDLRVALEAALGAEASALALRASTDGLRAVAEQHGASASGNEEETKAMVEATRALEARVGALQQEKQVLEQRLGSASLAVREAIDEYQQAEAALVKARDAHQASAASKVQAKTRFTFAAGRGSALEACVASLKRVEAAERALAAQQAVAAAAAASAAAAFRATSAASAAAVPIAPAAVVTSYTSPVAAAAMVTSPVPVPVAPSPAPAPAPALYSPVPQASPSSMSSPAVVVVAPVATAPAVAVVGLGMGEDDWSISTAAKPSLPSPLQAAEPFLAPTAVSPAAVPAPAVAVPAVAAAPRSAAPSTATIDDAFGDAFGDDETATTAPPAVNTFGAAEADAWGSSQVSPAPAHPAAAVTAAPALATDGGFGDDWGAATTSSPPAAPASADFGDDDFGAAFGSTTATAASPAAAVAAPVASSAFGDDFGDFGASDGFGGTTASAPAPAPASSDDWGF